MATCICGHDSDDHSEGAGCLIVMSNDEYCQCDLTPAGAIASNGAEAEAKITIQAARIAELESLMSRMIKVSRPPAYTRHGTSAIIPDNMIDEACQLLGQELEKKQ